MFLLLYFISTCINKANNTNTCLAFKVEVKRVFTISSVRINNLFDLIVTTDILIWKNTKAIFLSDYKLMNYNCDLLEAKNIFFLP